MKKQLEKSLKFVVAIQVGIIIYMARSNMELKDRIVESADAVSRSTTKIERLKKDTNELTMRNESLEYLLDQCRSQQFTEKDPYFAR